MVHKEVKEALKEVARKTKERYDQTHVESTFREGDWVMLFSKIPPSHFGKTWVGPFIIEEIMGPLTVKLRDSPQARLGRRHPIVNVSRIKLYKKQTLYEGVETPRARSQRDSGDEENSDTESEESDEEDGDTSATEEDSNGEETSQETDAEVDINEEEQMPTTPQQTGGLGSVGTPARRRRRLIVEELPDSIIGIQGHEWTGSEYQFYVQWRTGRLSKVGRDRLMKGSPQERHILNDYVRKNPGLASSLGGRMLQ